MFFYLTEQERNEYESRKKHEKKVHICSLIQIVEISMCLIHEGKKPKI